MLGQTETSYYGAFAMMTISHQRAAAMIKALGGDYASVKALGMTLEDGSSLAHVGGQWQLVPPVSGGAPDDGQGGPITIIRRSGPYDAKSAARWDQFGGDALMDSGAIDDGGEIRNEWPSEHGDSSGECFSTVEDFDAPDGHRYHALLTSYWDGSISPWVDTTITLYRVDDPAQAAQFAADVAEWEAKPELDPDFPTDDDDSDPDDGDTADLPPVSGGAPDGWGRIEGDDEIHPDAPAVEIERDGMAVVRSQATTAKYAADMLRRHGVYPTTMAALRALATGASITVKGDPNGLHLRVQIDRKESA